MPQSAENQALDAGCNRKTNDSRYPLYQLSALSLIFALGNTSTETAHIRTESFWVITYQKRSFKNGKKRNQQT